jgi:hypothetical protein
MENADLIVQGLLGTGKWSREAAQAGVRAGFKCEYCGLDFYASPENYKQFEVEHIVPLHNEGSVDFDNIAVACRTCNVCFKNRWDPRSAAGQNATRAELITAAKRYIRERKQITEKQIATEKSILQKAINGPVPPRARKIEHEAA